MLDLFIIVQIHISFSKRCIICINTFTRSTKIYMKQPLQVCRWQSLVWNYFSC